jgi:hypothetical protein
MRLLCTVLALGAVACLTIAYATAYLNDHHATWLERHDQDWASFSGYQQAQWRAMGIPPPWEMNDSQLLKFVGPSHAQRFRTRHPVAR